MIKSNNVSLDTDTIIESHSINRVMAHHAKTGNEFSIIEVVVSDDTHYNHTSSADENVVSIEFCVDFSDEEIFYCYIILSVEQFCKFINKAYVNN